MEGGGPNRYRLICDAESAVLQDFSPTQLLLRILHLQNPGSLSSLLQSNA